MTLGGVGAEGEKRFPHLGKQRGEQLGQKEKFGGSENSAATSLWQAGESEVYTNDLATALHAPAIGVHWCTRGLSVGMWGLKSRPRKGNDVGCEETAQGDRSEELHNKKCSWRKPRPPKKQSAIVE